MLSLTCWHVHHVVRCCWRRARLESSAQLAPDVGQTRRRRRRRLRPLVLVFGHLLLDALHHVGPHALSRLHGVLLLTIGRLVGLLHPLEAALELLAELLEHLVQLVHLGAWRAWRRASGRQLGASERDDK